MIRLDNVSNVIFCLMIFSYQCSVINDTKSVGHKFAVFEIDNDKQWVRYAFKELY